MPWSIAPAEKADSGPPWQNDCGDETMGQRLRDRQSAGTTSDSGRQCLRHCVATLAYRAAKTLRGSPHDFAEFRLPGSTRTPGAILAHMGDLLDWAVSMASGAREWHESAPLPWDREVMRFFAALEAFDGYLASDAPVRCPVERLFQGPIADALTHVGQLATRRRLAGAAVRGENYFLADITVGRVGPAQSAPRREFD